MSEQEFLEENIATVAFHLGQPGAKMSVNHDGGGVAVDPGAVLREISRRLAKGSDEPALNPTREKLELADALHWLGDRELAMSTGHEQDKAGCVLYFKTENACLQFMEWYTALEPAALRASVPADADAQAACLELAAKHGFATGHGDTVADMIREFSAQIKSVPADAGMGEPVTTEQLDKLQFGRVLHERPLPPRDAVRETFRNVDAQDWEWLLLRLDRSGRGRFWRTVFAEVHTALAALPPAQETKP